MLTFGVGELLLSLRLLKLADNCLFYSGAMFDTLGGGHWSDYELTWLKNINGTKSTPEVSVFFYKLKPLSLLEGGGYVCVWFFFFDFFFGWV